MLNIQSYISFCYIVSFCVAQVALFNQSLSSHTMAKRALSPPGTFSLLDAGTVPLNENWGIFSQGASGDMSMMSATGGIPITGPPARPSRSMARMQSVNYSDRKIRSLGTNDHLGPGLISMMLRRTGESTDSKTNGRTPAYATAASNIPAMNYYLLVAQSNPGNVLFEKVSDPNTGSRPPTDEEIMDRIMEWVVVDGVKSGQDEVLPARNSVSQMKQQRGFSPYYVDTIRENTSDDATSGVIILGETLLNDVFENDLTTGSRIYLILKRYPVEERYFVNQSSNEAEYPPAGARELRQYPFQFGLVAVPPHMDMPIDYLKYKSPFTGNDLLGVPLLVGTVIINNSPTANTIDMKVNPTSTSIEHACFDIRPRPGKTDARFVVYIG